MKRVFIIHGWEGTPRDGWYPWLKKELNKRGFAVKVPAMPDTDAPEIGAWVGRLAKLVKKPDKDTYFVGHSIGCQTIMRYLETVKGRVGGAVFVAGWFTLAPAATPDKEYRAVAKPWFETPIDLAKVKRSGKLVAFFSENDLYVPLSNAEAFRKKLGARIMMEKKRGHFGEEDGVMELPSVLEALLRMTGQ